MRILLSICLVAALLSLAGCFQKTEEAAYPVRGTIQGRDLGYCMCCDGYLIQIDSTVYRFQSVPENSGIQLEKETYPLEVKLAYTETGSCRHILIKRIKRNQ
ncbi:MAG: hypothetical protein K1X47_15990 [Cyclobacteriaceae bacterium]|nr:hypothetical protein [Cyclobacteriaceae bacterium]